MLTKEQKDKWVAALRSGEYKQTRKRLFSGKGYCCLGVFCTAVEGIKLKRSEVCDADEESPSFGHYERIKSLIGDHKFELVRLNDDGKSFAEISEYIEEKVPCA
jgi:hypothetical protein